MNIGERIRERRLELNMSQDDLAKAAGYKSRSSINKIEMDGRGLPQNKIVDIAKALRVTPAYLMGWEDEDRSSYYLDPEVAQMAQEMYERPEMRVLFDASRRATKEDIEAVANILEKMSQKQD